MSTRAILMLDLSFDEDGFICRATGSVNALESSRVASPGDGTNYDVLYKAVRDPSGKEWLGALDEFRLLGEEFDVSEYDKDASELNTWKQALATFGLDAALMVRFLCGLVLLGEVSFTSNKAGTQCQGPVDQAAKALGVQATHFSAALTSEGSVEAAEKARDATIEDVYACLLSKVIQQANSLMVGDSEPSGNSIGIVEMPAVSGAWPRALQPGSGLEMLMAQWLTETINSQLVPAAMHGYVQQLAEQGLKLDISRLSSQVSSSRALRAIEGPKGITQKLRPALSTNLTSESVRKDFTDWVRAVEKEATLTKEAPMAKVLGKTPEVSCEISGATTTMKHVLDLKLVQLCMGVSVPKKVKTLLLQSSQKLVSDVMKTTSLCLGSSKGLAGAEEAVNFVNGLLQSESKKRPWLVCCMRPNDKGKLNNISKPVLLKQARAFCLADLVHFAVGAQKASYSMVWPLPEFRKQYAALLPKIDKRTTEAEACRQAIATVADGQGIVGAEAVYGSQELAKMLDLRLQEVSPNDMMSKQASRKQTEDQMRRDASEKPMKKEASEKTAKKDTSETPLKQEASQKSMKNNDSETDARKEDSEDITSPISQEIEPDDGAGLCWCHCGTEFDEGASFCRNCGSKRPQVSVFVRCSCGTVFKDDAKFCRNCGNRRPAQAAEPVSCSSCGNTMSPDAVFCSNCGVKRQDAEAVASSRRSSFSSRTRSARRLSAPGGNLDRPSLLRSMSSDKIGEVKPRLLGGAPEKKKAADPRVENINNLVARSPSPPSSSGDEYDDQPMRPLDADTGMGFYASPMDNERGPFRSMALSQHATLHSALSQMAAVLRVAKESETKLRSNQNAHAAELEELRAECDAWRVESDRLWVQVKELQQQAFWRAPQSA
mmetsp:Transcript_5188/g.7501  ORF Transcript_5188/g.7501 Transcript_5188/m.7501 type:complete len:887 (-) Transcript_5188:153-2813(-)